MRLWVWSPEPMKNPTYGRKHYNEYWAASQPEAAPWGSLASSTGLVCEPQDTMRELVLKKQGSWLPENIALASKSTRKGRKEGKKHVLSITYENQQCLRSRSSGTHIFPFTLLSCITSRPQFLLSPVLPVLPHHFPSPIDPPLLHSPPNKSAGLPGISANTAQQVTVRLGANPLKKDGWDNPVGEKGFQE